MRLKVSTFSSTTVEKKPRFNAPPRTVLDYPLAPFSSESRSFCLVHSPLVPAVASRKLAPVLGSIRWKFPIIQFQNFPPCFVGESFHRCSLPKTQHVSFQLECHNGRGFSLFLRTGTRPFSGTISGEVLRTPFLQLPRPCLNGSPPLPSGSALCLTVQTGAGSLSPLLHRDLFPS